MKKLILAFVMLHTCVALMAQIKVVGTLVDSLTKDPEPFATVWLASASQQDKPIAASASDMDGKFSLTLNQKGEFIFKASSVGKTPVTMTLKNEGKDIELGTIYIAEDSKKIEGVDVIAVKPLVKMDIDRIEYSVKDDPDAKTNTVLEMLRKVPMVVVDGEDNITVNGSSSFQVYVNGKPNAMMSANPKETLRAMPATGIKSIAVLTNPGAKYDAEGVGGILNIETEQNSGMTGYTASLYAMGGNLVNGGGAYTMLQHDRITLGVNASVMTINTPETTTTGCRIETNGNKMEYDVKNNNKQNMGTGSVDFNFDIDTLNTVSLNVGFSKSKQETEMDNRTKMISNTGEYEYTTTTENETDSKSLNASVDYRHVFDNKSALTVAYRVNTQPRETEAKSSYTLEGMEDYNQTDKNNMTEQTLQADYEFAINEKNTFEVGAKFTNRNNNSSSIMLDYNHESNITGAYASYTLKYNSIGLKTGLRYEHTSQDVTYKKGNGIDFETTYDNWVPSASLSYSMGYTQTLGLGYNMRLSRPGISYLNPYMNTQSLTSVTYGNPNLDVEKANNLQATYSLFGQKLMLNATLKYSFVNNSIEEYSYNEGDITYTTYDNIGKRNTTSLNLFVNLTLFKGTRLMLNSTTSYVDLRASKLGYHNYGWQQSIMGNLQQDLPWDLKLSAMIFGNTDNISLQGKSAGMMVHTAGLSRSFLDKKMNVSVNCINPFKPSMKMNTETIAHDFSNIAKSNVNVRSLMFTVSINFGSMKQKSQRTKEYETDVINREEDGAGITKILVQ